MRRFLGVKFHVSHLKAGAIDQPFFQDVMRTPRMKEILNQTYPGVIKLREYAGYTGSRSRKKKECRNDLPSAIIAFAFF